MITKKKFKAIGWIACALLTLLFALFTIYAILKAGERNQDKLSVLNRGERTTATIISQKSVAGSWDDPSDTTSFGYTFSLSSGQEVIGGYQSIAIPSGWHVGDHIVIAYDRQNPDINVPVDVGDVNDSGYFWFAAILASLVFGGLTFFFGYKAWETW